MNPKSKQQLREHLEKHCLALHDINPKSNDGKNGEFISYHVDQIMQAFESFHTGEVEKAVREARIDELDKAVKYIKQSPFAYPMLEGGFFNGYCNNRLEHLQSIESDKS